MTHTGNCRVLGWDGGIPDADRPVDLRLGQPDMFSSAEWPYGPYSGDRFRFPYALGLDRDRLAVADTAQNRVLIREGSFTDGRPADHVLAPPSFTKNGENRWSSVERDTLCWPYGLSLHGDALAVSDSGNNRVVLWRRR